MTERSLPKEALETISTAFEVAGSYSRNTALNALEAADEAVTGDKHYSTIPYSDIAHGNQFMTAERFMDGVANVFGGEYKTHGSNWLESTGKFASELLVDIATDPISYIPVVGQGYAIGKGIGRTAAKYALGKNLSKTIAKYAPKALEEYVPKIANNITTKTLEKAVNQTVSRGVIGLGVGAAYPVAENDGQVSGRLVNALKGAGVTASMSPLMKGITGGLKLGSNLTVDAIYSRAKPDVIDKYKKVLDPKNEFLSMSKNYETVRRAKDRFSGLTREINVLNNALIEKYGPDEINKAIETFDRIIPKFVETRNHVNKVRKIRGKDFVRSNQTTEELNEYFVNELRKSDKWTPVMDDLIKRNKFIVSEYNKERAKVAAITGKKHAPMAGIDLHTPEILTPDNLGNYSSPKAKAGFLKRATEDSVETAGLTGVQRLAVESDRVIFNMMNKHEKNAVRFMTEMANAKSKSDFFNGGAKVLDLFDDITMDLKGSMLTLSYSWLRNNFAENTMRAYMEHGLVGGVKALGKQAKAVASRIPHIKNGAIDDQLKDLHKITSSEKAATDYIKFADKSELTEIGRDLGVLSGGFYKETLGDIVDKESKALLVAKHGKARAEEKILSLAEKGIIGRTKDKILASSKKAIGETGSLIENTARLNTFELTVKRLADKAELADIKKYGYKQALVKNPNLAYKYEEARDIVNKTFFNYSDLSMGEERVLKRLFPFYSFYSKNLNYWGDMISNEIAKVNRGVKLTGQATNQDVNADLSTNIEFSQYERSIPHGKSKDGKFKTMGNTSLSDFLEALSSSVKYTQGKVHPFLNAGTSVAQIIGRQIGAFDEPTDSIGRKLLVSDSEKKVRKAYYNENKFAKVDELLGSPFGTVRDKDGNLQVTSDVIPTAAAIASAIPIPIVDAAARVSETHDIMNEVSPVKTKEKTSSELRKTRNRNRKELKKQAREYRNEQKVKALTSSYTEPSKVNTSQARHIAQVTDNGSMPLMNTKEETPKTTWNMLGIKSSPQLINRLVKSEGFVPTARRLPLAKGGRPEKHPSIGYSFYNTYPATFGEHKKGSPIRVGDTMSKEEAAYQLVSYIKDKERLLNKTLDSAGVKVTTGMYDILMHSVYNVGPSHLKKIKEHGISGYFMRIPATVKGVLSKQLLARRIQEYDVAKSEAQSVLSLIEQKVTTSALSVQDKDKILRQARNDYYFPDYRYMGKGRK